jgi:predicted transcriptional regulator
MVSGTLGGLPAIRSAAATQYNRIMSSQTSRDRILEALQDLPADATFDDAIERLVFLAKIDAGLAELDAGQGIPHDEAKRRLGL